MSADLSKVPMVSNGPAAPRRATMADKVAAIKRELRLDVSLSIAAAVAAANADLDLEDTGKTLDKVNALMEELFLDARLPDVADQVSGLGRHYAEPLRALRRLARG